MAMLFTKSLSDLIRGLRGNKRNEEAYITQCLDECRKEVRSSDMDIKAQAVAKLAYLNMLGYDMAWASFHIVEVMSSSKFAYKRLGYLAASMSFQQDTEVLIMCTNLFKKDLSSNNYLEVSLALGGLAQIVTPDLARTLLNDLLNMLNNSRPYIRKRTVLLLYKVFLKYPEALKIAFPRLREKLEDPDELVVCAAVNVICELAQRNPKNYIILAPQLYGLMTTSANNWMLIKIVKLFGILCPIEPRLAKKLLPPLTNLIQSTNAMSLLYESIHTVVSGGLLTAEGVDASSLSALCISRLRIFLEETDPNLKYLGLYILAKLLTANPRAVLEHKEIVLKCLEDADSSIRLRALDIVTGMVTPKNLKELVKRLIHHLVPSEKGPNFALEAQYRDEVVRRIVALCSRDTYELVQDFEWYIDVLVDLVHFSGVNVSSLLNAQLMDVGIRVVGVREYAVQMMAKLLVDRKLFDSANSPTSNIEVIHAAAWLVGEFRKFLSDPFATMASLLGRPIQRLPSYVQIVCLQSAMKVYSSLIANTDGVPIAAEEFGHVTKAAREGMEAFAGSSDLEVQQRASEFLHLLVTAERHAGEKDVARNVLQLRNVFVGDLNPVGPKAQKRVPVPEGLDLDEAFVRLPERTEDSLASPERANERGEEDGLAPAQTSPRKSRRRSTKARADVDEFKETEQQATEESEEDEETKEQRRREREARIESDPFYISRPRPQKKQPVVPEPLELDVDSIPIVKLDIADFAAPLTIAKAKKAGKKTKSSEPAGPSKTYQVVKGEELPEGAVPIDEVAESRKASRRKGAAGVDDELNLASVDLTEELAESAPAAGKAKTRRKPKKRTVVVDAGEVQGTPADRSMYESL
ncbi:adaptin N terminal region-domain-containing protein [Hyaloraphidium curvatum]|nr:adaptin N terminal region-domain-containing protein [Hyaloraphidium curvatum]